MKRNFKLLVSVIVLVVMVFTLASCDKIQGIIDKFVPGGEPEHEHEFSAEWSSDATNHWHAAICEDGEECASATADVAAHVYENGACSVCGYKIPECAEHAPGAPEVIKAATCTEAGERKFTCTVCSYSWTQEIAPEGHTEVTLEGKLPNCTESGLSSGKKCSVCEAIIKEQTVLDPEGHKFVGGQCSVCKVWDPEYTGPRTYVFDAQDIEAFAANAANLGKVLEGNFSDFFTFYLSDKTKVESGKKATFEDGYTVSSGNRLNLNGGTAINTTPEGATEAINKNALMFAVPEGFTATVKVWWTCGGDGREVAIFNEDGEMIAASAHNDTFAENEGIGSAKNATYIDTLSIDTNGTYYLGTDDKTNAPKGGGNIWWKVEVVLTPVEKEPAKEIKVETTDTYTMYDLDFFTFTATAEGYYTFKIPAGLGVLKDGANAPEIDYYDNANGYEFTIGLKADQEVKFWVSSTTKDLWTIEWSFEEGEVKEDESDTPIEGDATELVVGPNTVVFGDGQLSEGKTYPFVVTEEGTYTFRCDLMAVVMDADGNTMGRGQAYLVPGNYTVALFSMMPMPANSFVVNITFEAPATGEPNGSEQYPYVWETLPESVTFESDNINMVYYVFTATADGSVTFTWAVEGNDWFNYFELVEGATTENNGSGFAKTSHTFVVEAGKTYRVGLGTWIEGGETVVSIAFNACAHVWSEATCTTPSTCSSCGATTGDKAEHTSSGEATCQNPEVCTVCGFEMSTVDHTWGEPTDVIAPDCSTMTEGSQKLTCTVCGHEETETLWAYHAWDRSQCVEATCTTNGKYYAVCTVCGEIESYDIEAQGHYNYFATCGETTNCMECGEEFTLEHSGDPATCTEAMYCYNCWQYVGEPAGHNFVDGVCSVCGEPAPVEELKATVDNEFTSDKANHVALLYNKNGAWGVETNGENKNEAGAPVGNIGGLDKADKYVAYEFILTEAGYVDFVWSVAGSNWNGSGNSGLTDMGNHMIITIDDEFVNIGGIELLPGEGNLHWWNLQKVVVKDVYLEAGVHTFYCDIAADGYGLNAGAMNIYSTSAVALKNAVVSSADLIEKDGKIYYAFTMNMVGYTVDDIRIWNDKVDYEISVVEEGENGETIVMVDVSELPIGTKIYPHMSFAGKNYVNNANASGDVRDMGLVVEEQYIKFGDKYFGIISEWSMPTLIVIQAVSAITSADIVEENGSVYYVLTYNVVGYDPATFEFFDGNTVFPVESYSVDGNSVAFKMNVTNLSAGTTIWPHLRVNGENWDGDKGDVKVACQTETIELNGKTYTLKVQYEMPTVVVATAG